MYGFTKSLVVDSKQGIYIPFCFADSIKHNLKKWKVYSDDIAALLEGPEHCQYWEVWDDVLNHAVFTDMFDCKWSLYQDEQGDLWLVRDDHDWYAE